MSNKDLLKFEDVFEEKLNKMEIVSAEDELNIPEVKVTVDINFEKIESKGEKDDFENDIQYVRTKLLHSIGQADKILNSVIGVITATEQTTGLNEPPRGFHNYYDVSTQLLKSICEASKELINLHTQNLKTRESMGWMKKEETEVKSENGEEIVNKNKSNLRDIVNAVKEIKSE
jgi:hypothetical protein